MRLYSIMSTQAMQYQYLIYPLELVNQAQPRPHLHHGHVFVSRTVQLAYILGGARLLPVHSAIHQKCKAAGRVTKRVVRIFI